MGSNYWSYEKLIDATSDQLEEHLKYEFDMFRNTCNQLNQPQNTTFERNLLLESLPTHIRILTNFFYGEKKCRNDLIAQDFLPKNINWANERPPQTKLLIDAKNKADKQLAHLSRWRVKIQADNKKGWDWGGIKADIEQVIKIFEKLKLVA